MHTKLFFVLLSLLNILPIYFGLRTRLKNDLYLSSLQVRQLDNSKLFVNFNNKSVIIEIEENNKSNKTVLNILNDNTTSFFPKILSRVIRKDDCQIHSETQLNPVDVIILVAIGLAIYFFIVVCNFKN